MIMSINDPMKAYTIKPGIVPTSRHKIQIQTQIITRDVVRNPIIVMVPSPDWSNQVQLMPA